MAAKTSRNGRWPPFFCFMWPCEGKKKKKKREKEEEDEKTQRNGQNLEEVRKKNKGIYNKKI